MNGFFVTGTDTGVGKSYVAAGLIGALRQEGVPVVGFKPIETGVTEIPMDAALLAEASELSVQETIGQAYGNPLAPAVAARIEDTPIDWPAIEAKLQSLAARGPVVVEGAGGITVPVEGEIDMLGLAKKWGLGVVVVARPNLGTLNHTKLTVDACQSAGVHVLGVIVSNYPDTPDLAMQTNLQWLPRLTGVPLLGVVPVGGTSVSEMVAGVQGNVELRELIAACNH